MPSTPVPLSPSGTLWDELFGPRLEVHDRHGYSTFTTARATSSVLFGRTSVGVYFSADWCPSCVEFSPLLLKYYNARRNDHPPLQIVLVSRCRSSQNTRNFFDPMPWAALPHLESMGARGQSLMTRFGITTIPALVFLDMNGKVTCVDGRRMVAADNSAAASVPMGDLPPQPPTGPRRVGRPTGDPPSFGRERLRSPSTTQGEPRARSVSPAAVLAELRADVDEVIDNDPTDAPTGEPTRARRPSEHVSPPGEPRRRLTALKPGIPLVAEGRAGTRSQSKP